MRKLEKRKKEKEKGKKKKKKSTLFRLNKKREKKMPALVQVAFIISFKLPRSKPKYNSPSSCVYKDHTLQFPKLKRRQIAIAMAENSVIERQQQVILKNNYGEKLVGILHDTGSKDVVILCHGFRSSKNQKTMVNLAAALEGEGISAFRFDFSGNGESDGSFEYGNYMKEVEDLCAVVKHFSSSDRTASAIVGHSKGGGIVLLYASKYHDVRTVVNLSGRYKMERGIEERLGANFMERIKKDGYIDTKNNTGKVMYRVTKESLMERLNTNMHEACLNIDEKCRVLTVHGSDDEIIPVEDAYEFSKIISNHKLHIIEGADHAYNSHQAELVLVVKDFIKSCLQQDNESSARVPGS